MIDKDNKPVYAPYLWLMLSMFFPIALAAIRADNVGTDISIYVEDTFESVLAAESLLDAWDDLAIEPLYVLIAYIAKYLSSDLWSILFLTELCVVVPFWVSFVKLRNRVNATYALFLFYGLMYNHTLNMMRQSIALAFVFLAVVYMFDKRYKQMIFFLIIAFGFHITTILALLLPLGYLFSQRYQLFEYKRIYVIVILACIILASYLVSIILFLVDFDVLDVKYLIYTDTSVFEARISKSIFVIIIVELLLLLKSLSYSGDKYAILSFFFLACAATFIFSMTGTIVSFLARTSWYFQIISFISMSYCLCKPNVIPNAKGIRVAFTALICFYWWFAIVHSGESETIPYATALF